MVNYSLRMSMFLLRSFGSYVYLPFSLAFYVLCFIIPVVIFFLIYHEYKWVIVVFVELDELASTIALVTYA